MILSTRIDREPHARLLLRSLIEPAGCVHLDLDSWDLLVRAARAARLLGVLGHLLSTVGVVDSLPAVVRAHLVSQQREDLYRCAEADRATREVMSSLAGIPVVLLKGIGYIQRGLPWARSRIFSDIDVMVPREMIELGESRLTERGWTPAELNEYDERYYRRWSHEIPPLSHEEFRFDLDLHHTILPPTGRSSIDAASLFEAADTLESGYRVLCPEDQFLHTAAHCVQDSDFLGSLRDLVDIWLMGRHFDADPGFGPRLIERARQHRLERTLFWACLLTERLFGESDFSRRMLAGVDRSRPSRASVKLMTTLVPGAAFPPGPKSSAAAIFAARFLLMARYQWLRLPPALLAGHVIVKGIRHLTAR